VLAGAAAVLAVVALMAVAVFGHDAAGFLAANRAEQHMVAHASVPNELGALLGYGGATPAIKTAALAILAAVLVFLFVRTWRGADWIRCAGWATLALLVCSAWLMPWYVVWLLPLAAIGRSRRLELATLALCAYIVYMRTPF
jgi:hypothetical protein